MAADPTLAVLGAAGDLTTLGETVKTALTVTAVCSLRGYVAMLMMPPTSSTILLGAVRNGVALTFGAFAAMGQPFDAFEAMNAGMLMLLILKEGLIGLLIGFAAATIFWTIEGIGTLIDNQAGFNSVQQNNPLSGEQSTPVANLLLQLAVTAFYLLGGMLAFAGLLIDSHRWWPVTKALPDWSGLLAGFLPEVLRNYTGHVLGIAAPLIVILLLIDIAVGLLNKAADKLEPNNHTQPIKGAVTMVMLVTLIALFFQQARPQLALQPAVRQVEAWFSRGAPPR